MPATSDALAQHMTAADILDGAMNSLRKKIAKALMTDEQMIAALQADTETEARRIRQETRATGAQMRALADPDTKQLEPLEALRARKARMLSMAAGWEKERQALESKAAEAEAAGNTDEAAKLHQQAGALKQQIAQGALEIQALQNGELGVNENTYGTLKDAYELQMKNLAAAEQAVRVARLQAPAMLQALKANKTAKAIADKARYQSTGPDLWYVNDLQKEMETAAAERRADDQIDRDLDATQPVSVFDQHAEGDVAEAPADIMAEITAAAAAK